MKIIGLLLIKNEDLNIEIVVKNIIDFCDEIIVLDNYSRDNTFKILTNISKNESKIHLYKIKSPKTSHSYVTRYVNTDTWLFAIDGDEIYDPIGLSIFKEKLKNKEFNNFWVIYGNVLHVTYIDRCNKIARGFSSPPSRSMTKMYNFSLIEKWNNCSQRLHGGNIVFKKGHSGNDRKNICYELQWEESYFRCLHTVFIPRSSIDKSCHERINIGEKYRIKRLLIHFQFISLIKLLLELFIYHKNYKNLKYCTGR